MAVFSVRNRRNGPRPRDVDRERGDFTPSDDHIKCYDIILNKSSLHPKNVRKHHLIWGNVKFADI